MITTGVFWEVTCWKTWQSFYEHVVSTVRKSHTCNHSPSEGLRELGSDLEATTILLQKNLDPLWPPCMSQDPKFHVASYLSPEISVRQEYNITYFSFLLLIWIRGIGKSTSFGGLFHYLISCNVKSICFISHLNLYSSSCQSLDFPMTSYIISKCVLLPHVFFPEFSQIATNLLLGCLKRLNKLCCLLL